MNLTKKQKKILDYLHNYIQDHGYSPTYEEIADYFGYRSKGTVHKHITNLEQRGFIKKDWNKNRALEITTAVNSPSRNELPLLGRVAAGEPIEAIEDSEVVAVPPDMIGSGQNYVLEVRGDSMIEENIQDGDYVIISPRSTAEQGETVVVLIDNQEATLKKFYYDDAMVRLQPANKTMQPIFVEPERIQIRGIVIGVMRKYK